MEQQIALIEEGWDEVAASAGMNPVERDQARRRQILNPYALEGFDEVERDQIGQPT